MKGSRFRGPDDYVFCDAIGTKAEDAETGTTYLDGVLVAAA